MNCTAIEKEWLWINEFLILSDTLDEPSLDLIPGFWSGSKENTTDHPHWKDMRLIAEEIQPHLPYSFKKVDAGAKAGKILATPQNKNLRLLTAMSELPVSQYQGKNRSGITGNYAAPGSAKKISECQIERLSSSLSQK